MSSMKQVVNPQIYLMNTCYKHFEKFDIVLSSLKLSECRIENPKKQHITLMAIQTSFLFCLQVLASKVSN